MTDTARSSTVGDIVRRSARQYADRPALVSGGRSWTYRGLDAAVSRAAAALLDHGLRHGDRVAVIGHSSDASVLAFLACARAGLVHVPAPPTTRDEGLEHLLTDSAPAAVLVDPDLRARMDHIGVPGSTLVLSLSGDPTSLVETARRGPVPGDDDSVPDDAPLQLLYDLGTGEDPRAIRLTHRALVHACASAVIALECHPEDRPLHVIGHHLPTSLHAFLLPYLAVGAANAVTSTADIAEILERIKEHDAGALFLPPELWTRLAEDDSVHARNVVSLHKAFCSAPGLPQPALDVLRARAPGLGFYTVSGRPEIASLATVLSPAEHHDHPNSYGRPVLFVEMRVVDATGADVGVGQVGEVVYRSPQLFDGHGPAASLPEEGAGGWFRSGDVVRREVDGLLTRVSHFTADHR
ncbi:AMP-binding protein [Pseudonocardia sp. TMWB2A]|uniref:AMP-binding protein n=1 Tax=Pseudonocardia sp. TMWB2A TaxID=687430 RepID=UPI00307DB762